MLKGILHGGAEAHSWKWDGQHMEMPRYTAPGWGHLCSCFGDRNNLKTWLQTSVLGNTGTSPSPSSHGNRNDKWWLYPDWPFTSSPLIKSRIRRHHLSSSQCGLRDPIKVAECFCVSLQEDVHSPRGSPWIFLLTDEVAVGTWIDSSREAASEFPSCFQQSNFPNQSLQSNDKEQREAQVFCKLRQGALPAPLDVIGRVSQGKELRDIQLHESGQPEELMEKAESLQGGMLSACP